MVLLPEASGRFAETLAGGHMETGCWARWCEELSHWEGESCLSKKLKLVNQGQGDPRNPVGFIGKHKDTGQVPRTRDKEPRESGMDRELQVDGCQPSRYQSVIQREVPLCPPKLGPLVKFNSYSPPFFNENRIWIILGIKEAWVSFPRE